MENCYSVQKKPEKISVKEFANFIFLAIFERLCDVPTAALNAGGLNAEYKAQL